MESFSSIEKVRHFGGHLFRTWGGHFPVFDIDDQNTKGGKDHLSQKSQYKVRHLVVPEIAIDQGSKGSGEIVTHVHEKRRKNDRDEHDTERIVRAGTPVLRLGIFLHCTLLHPAPPIEMIECTKGMNTR
jgi:hypothetical protein